MPLGEFFVECEEEGIAAAFIRDTGGRGPGTVSKVLSRGLEKEKEYVSVSNFKKLHSVVSARTMRGVTNLGSQGTKGSSVESILFRGNVRGAD